MVQRVSSRFLVLIISFVSILSSLIIISIAILLIRQSRSVSGNIGLRIYQLYGDSILGLYLTFITRIEFTIFVRWDSEAAT